jgi:hypothetical protein
MKLRLVESTHGANGGDLCRIELGFPCGRGLVGNGLSENCIEGRGRLSLVDTWGEVVEEVEDVLSAECAGSISLGAATVAMTLSGRSGGF